MRDRAPAAEVMPPTGNHPVRAARKTSVERADQRRHRQAGHRNRADDRPANAARSAAGIDAERQADQRGDHDGGARQDGGVERALAQERGDGPRIQQRAAEVQLRHAAQPRQILDRDRPVEAKLGAQPRAGFRVHPDRSPGDVTGRQLREQEGGRRDDEDQQDSEAEAPQQVSPHARDSTAARVAAR